MPPRSQRIFKGNKDEHAFSLHLEARGYMTIHPPKSIAPDEMKKAPDFRDSYDFLYGKPGQGIRAAMVKVMGELSAFSVDSEHPDPIADIIETKTPVLIDPTYKWADKSEEWWSQRDWFICDELMTFALVIPGEDHCNWPKPEKHTRNESTQEWHVFYPDHAQHWLELKDIYTRKMPFNFNQSHVVELASQASQILD